MKNIRVLDERKISFKVEEGLLEVYDQKDFLVGDRPLPIPIEENMSVDDIYSIAEQCGYNVDEMIAAILKESVIDNMEYDVWLSYEEIIFYSPSSQDWVSEPYEGIFKWLDEYFSSEEELTEEVTNIEDNNSESDEDEDEVYRQETSDSEKEYEDDDNDEDEYDEVEYDKDEEDEERTSEIDEDIKDFIAETVEDEVKDTTDDLDDAIDEAVEEEIKEVTEDLDDLIEDTVEDEVKEVTEGLDEVIEEAVEDEVMEVTEDLDEAINQAVEEKVNEATKHLHDIIEDKFNEVTDDLEEDYCEEAEEQNSDEGVNMNMEIQLTNEEKEKRIGLWKEAYREAIKDEKSVEGMTLKKLSKQVAMLVLEHDNNIFNVDEKDILFELAMQGTVIFGGVTALRAGFYRAYMFADEND